MFKEKSNHRVLHFFPFFPYFSIYSVDTQLLLLTFLFLMDFAFNRLDVLLFPEQSFPNFIIHPVQIRGKIN